MSKIAQFIQTEMPAIGSAVAALFALVAGLGASLTTTQTAGWEAGIAAGLAMFAGIFVRPFALSLLSGLVSAAGTLLASYGIHGATPGLVSLVNALITTVFALIVVRPRTLPAAEYRKLRHQGKTLRALRF